VFPTKPLSRADYVGLIALYFVDVTSDLNEDD
jgi:hypothetical protein